MRLLTAKTANRPFFAGFGDVRQPIISIFQTKISGDTIIAYFSCKIPSRLP